MPGSVRIYGAAVLLGAIGGCAARMPGGQQGGGTTGGRTGTDAANSGAGSGNAGQSGYAGGAGLGGFTGLGGNTLRPDGGSAGVAGAGGGAGLVGVARPDGGLAGSIAGTSGSEVDSGRPDATVRLDGGSTSACPGLFCEDFEKGLIDSTIWEVKVNGGQPPPTVVSGARLVAHGRYSAHFHAGVLNPNVASYDFIIIKNAPAALKGHHFGRAYFMVTPMPPTNHTEYIFAGTEGFPQLKYLEVASAAPLVWQLTYVDLVPPGTGEDYHSGGKVPIGKWFCLEWEFNDAPDQAAVYLDGTAAPAFAQNTFSFNGATSGLVGGFAAFGFGYYAWHPATYAFDVYYDDIVLDTKRIGCLD